MSNNLPLACDLTAIDEAERSIHKQNSESVFEAIQAIRERPDGYAFRLPAQTAIIEQAGAFIARERLCCPFFHFSLVISPGHGPVWLHLGGNENVKQFIAKSIIPQLTLSSTKS